MHTHEHPTVHWDQIWLAISIGLSLVSAAIGPNRVGRLCLLAGAYVSAVFAYYVYTAGSGVDPAWRIAVAFLATCLFVIVAWKPARRFLQEENVKPATAERSAVEQPTRRDAPAEPAPPDPRIGWAIERQAEEMQRILTTGIVPEPDPAREHVKQLLAESALMPPNRPLSIDLERFATIAHRTARRWSNETASQPVRMLYGTETQFGLSRGPVAATLTRNGDRVDVEVGSLDYQTPYKTVPLTEHAAEEIGKEIGQKMRA
jgi:hypothetical protein